MARIDVNVSWREIPLLSHVTLSDVSDSGGFLATDAPMPVGTMLILTPLRHEEVFVPARVTATVEGTAGVPGMRLAFEAAGDALLSLTEGPTEEPVAAEPVASEEDDIPVVTIEAEPQQVRDSGLAPVVSGEIHLPGEPAYGVFPRERDPDAPDKVIVEVEADADESEEAESAAAGESAVETESAAEEPDEDDAADAAEDVKAAGDEGAAAQESSNGEGRRKRRKGKRKKKKK